MIILGNCLDKLKELKDNSVDSIVTDPPYELGFMGKKWDNTGISYNIKMWAECLRVLKPGGHLLSFGGTRTYHRMTCAIEDAGFEIRDMIEWVYGSGFPKSLNISKAISKLTKIGLCSCGVPETFINKEVSSNNYEENNKQRDNLSNGEGNRFGISKQIQSERTNNNEMETQISNTTIPSNCSLLKESELCELSETYNKKEQGFEKVTEPILLQGMCKSIPENKRYGNFEIRTGLEETQTTSEGERQGLSDMQNETKNGITSSSLNTFQNEGQEYNGEFGGSLSELSQQDRENNGKGNTESENESKIREWNIDNRFICPQCRNIKTDIGGSSLKPAHEPICMARKPLEAKTVAENCLKWGTGGINIDESRVDFVSEEDFNFSNRANYRNYNLKKPAFETFSGDIKTISKASKTSETNLNTQGRFPANLIHDNSEEVKECFPESNATSRNNIATRKDDSTSYGGKSGQEFTRKEFGDKGNASRFFKSIIYTAKASKSERNKGCEELEEKQRDESRKEGNPGGDNPRNRGVNKTHNNHPTVKPIKLMEYLIKMVTPKGGIVLDPFAGSGTTLVAAKMNGFRYIGIELTEEHIPIIKCRLLHLEKKIYF